MNPSTLAGPLDAARTYSTDDVCALAGLTYRTVDYWIRRGVIAPEVAAAGSGTQRVFTAEQVAAFRVAAGLRRLGVELDRIAELVAVARDLPEGVSLVWTGESFTCESDPWAVMNEVRRSGGSAVVVSLAP